MHLAAQDACPLAVHDVDAVMPCLYSFCDRCLQAFNGLVGEQAVQVDFGMWSARGYSPPWYLNDSFTRAR